MQESKYDWRKLFSMMCHSVSLFLLYPKAQALTVKT